MQFPQIVHGGGLGLAADLPPGAFPIAGVRQRYLAAPQTRAMPVAFGVTARTAVLEGDPGLTAPASSGHEGESTPKVGTMVLTMAPFAGAL
jgi:hypothetical protein